MKIEEKIQNSHLLTDIFGYWPSFHDAEVLSLTINSKMTNNSIPSAEIIGNGKYRLKVLTRITKLAMWA